MPLALTLCLLLFGHTALAENQLKPVSQPIPYTATYELLRNGDLGALITATLELVEGEPANRYRYRLESSDTRGLARVVGFKSKEVSEFVWQDGHLQPLSYDSQIKAAFSKDREEIQFDRESGTAQVNNDDGEFTLELTPHLLDPLTAQQHLSLMTIKPGEELDLSVIDGDEIKQQHFKATGREQRAAGTACIELVRVERVREPESNRSNWLVLETARHGLPWVIGRDKRGGDRYEMHLKSVDGEPVPAIANPDNGICPPEPQESN